MKSIILSTTLILAMILCQAQNSVKINQCVIENGILREVEVDYDRSTGEKTVNLNGVRTDVKKAFASTGQYAEGTTWFINNEELVIGKNKYVKYGLPRVLGVREIEKSSVYKGVGVYAEAGLTGTAEVIYIPVRMGCEFQPYQLKPPPCGILKITANKATVKSGQTVTFTATLTGAKGTLNYSWETVNGEIPEDNEKKTVTVTAGQVGDLIVFVDIYGTGCASAAKKVVKVVK